MKKIDSTTWFKFKLGLASGLFLGFIILAIINSVNKFQENSQNMNHENLVELSKKIEILVDDRNISAFDEILKSDDSDDDIALINFFVTLKKDLQLIDHLHNVGVNFNFFTENVKTLPLSSAISRGDFEVAERLIKCGADINMPDGLGKYAIIYAVEKDIKALEFCITVGADVSKHSLNESPILHYAIASGNVQTFRYLIEHKLSPQNDLLIPDDYGFSAIHKSVMSGSIEMLMEVIYYDVDIYALTQNEHNITFLLPNEQIAEYVLQKFVFDMNQQDIFGKIPLHYAAENLTPKIIEIMIQQGSMVNATDNDGKTPLDFAKKENESILMLYGGVKNVKK